MADVQKRITEAERRANLLDASKSPALSVVSLDDGTEVVEWAGDREQPPRVVKVLRGVSMEDL